MNPPIEPTIEMDFDFQINPADFINMSEQDRQLTLSSLSEKEKFANLKFFKTLPNGKVGWNK